MEFRIEDWGDGDGPMARLGGDGTTIGVALPPDVAQSIITSKYELICPPVDGGPAPVLAVDWEDLPDAAQVEIWCSQEPEGPWMATVGIGATMIVARAL